MSMEAFKELMSGLGEVAGQVWDEMERPAIQGQAELAAALFSGSAFVPYGEGQQSAAAPQQEQAEAGNAPAAQPEMERGGRE